MLDSSRAGATHSEPSSDKKSTENIFSESTSSEPLATNRTNGDEGNVLKHNFDLPSSVLKQILSTVLKSAASDAEISLASDEPLRGPTREQKFRREW